MSADPHFKLFHVRPGMHVSIRTPHEARRRRRFIIAAVVALVFLAGLATARAGGIITTGPGITVRCTTTDQVLQWSVASGTWVCSSGTNITGTGTTNTLPKFTSADVLGNSSITDNGTIIAAGEEMTFGHSGAVSYTSITNNGVLNYDTTTGNLVVAAQNSGGTSHVLLATSNSGNAITQVDVGPTSIAVTPATTFSGNVTGNSSIILGADHSAWLQLGEYNNSTYTNALIEAVTTGSGMAFRAGGSDRITIGNAGAVTVGVTSGGVVNTVTINNTSTVAGAVANESGLVIVDHAGGGTTANVGGSIEFDGTYSGSTVTAGAVIRVLKNNTTGGDFGFNLAFATRKNGAGDVARAMLVNNDQSVIFDAHIVSKTQTVSLTNATCASTVCTNVAGTISTTSTAPSITFTTFTGAKDANCAITPIGTAAAPTAIAHTATTLSWTATNTADYSYVCISTGT